MPPNNSFCTQKLCPIVYPMCSNAICNGGKTKFTNRYKISGSESFTRWLVRSPRPSALYVYGAIYDAVYDAIYCTVYDAVYYTIYDSNVYDAIYCAVCCTVFWSHMQC